MSMDVDWTGLTADTPELGVHYVRAGRGKPVVLLHGWPEFARTWKHTLPVLAERFDVLAPELRGFGRTETKVPRATGGSPPQLLARDLRDFADTVGLSRFAIVSHDVGAAVAHTFALAYPERVSALFFFNCPYPGIGKRWGEPAHAPETWYQQFHQKDFAAALVGSSREACRIYLSHFLSHWSRDPHAFDGVLEEWVDNFMRPGNLQGGFDWYVGVSRLRRQLMLEGAPPMPQVSAPSRFLWGRHDPVLKVEWVDRLPDYFTSPEIEIAEEAGHFVHFEQPALANARIAEFLARVLG
ncbi:MAG: alpha/beta fold hydrolase [Hyphomicrobiaceae bacterium]